VVDRGANDRQAEQSGFINQSKEEMLEEFKAELRANGEL
jgi:hypothetical protein